jgi:hypothetical protein
MMLQVCIQFVYNLVSAFTHGITTFAAVVCVNFRLKKVVL